MTAEKTDCKRHESGDEALDGQVRGLPRNQGGAGRHKCAYCAYELGLAEGRREAAALRGRNGCCAKHRGGCPELEDAISRLPENQGGAGRHRCPYCAYEKGRRAGLESGMGRGGGGQSG